MNPPVGMRVLVTGGAGFIGSHTCVALAKEGFAPVVFDNFSNGSREAVRRVRRIAGCEVPCIEGDVRDVSLLGKVLREHAINAVIHFAALKAVGESVAQPLRYFDNNITGTITLLQAMLDAGVNNLVFSSSATVYGNASVVPVIESAATSVTNPYGRTKLVMEELINDVCVANADLGAVVLRYFNPIGAHPGGEIGEDPLGEPNNLMPYLTQVAVGRRKQLRIFGADWQTPDGTGVRDYIHVMDLAQAHVAALQYLNGAHRGMETVNVGTGRGTSVLELLHVLERVTDRQLPHVVVDRRPGDVAALWADVTKARRVLGWEARYGIEHMCEDAWRWQKQNPRGYDEAQ